MKPRIQSELVWRTSPECRGQLKADLAIDLRKGYRGQHVFCLDGIPFATLNDDLFTTLSGYRSDLCSPAVKIRGRYIGTPTTRHEVAAAFTHDAMRTALGCPCCPFDRKITDDTFYDLLLESGSRWTPIYHGAVAGIIGSFYIWLSRFRKAPAITCQHHEKSP